jgi:hypothetical protein
VQGTILTELNVEARQQVVAWIDDNLESVPEPVRTFLVFHRKYLAASAKLRQPFGSAVRELRRVLGITPASERRRSFSGDPSEPAALDSTASRRDPGTPRLRAIAGSETVGETRRLILRIRSTPTCGPLGACARCFGLGLLAGGLFFVLIVASSELVLFGGVVLLATKLWSEKAREIPARWQQLGNLVGLRIVDVVWANKIGAESTNQMLSARSG